MSPFRKHSRIASASIAAIISAMLAGCFTGIESTPKITDSDVKRHEIAPGADDTYPSDIRFGNFSTWEPGKLFLVTDTDISKILRDTDTGIAASLAVGDTLVYECARQSATLTGDMELTLTLSDRLGHRYDYRTARTAESVASEHPFEIPFAEELSIVEQVRRIMNGQTYYTVSSNWLDTRMQPRTGRKFVPVRVTDVTGGNAFYHILLHLTDENGSPFTLYMNVGTGHKAPRRFSSMLSRENPRNRYPDITDATWTNIVNGRVAADMTRDECRLALGAPDNVDRSPGYSILREVWTYDNGIYLIFEDGLLRRFRQ